MDVKTLLRGQTAEMHRILELAIGDCVPEMTAASLPGAKINSIGAIYSHAVFSEDSILNGAVRGLTPVYVAGGWADKIGLEMQHPDWNPQVDLGLFREYAAAVYQATDDYLAAATGDELDRAVDLKFLPPMPVASLIANVLVWHTATHQGEISALKGVRGVEGLALSH